MLDKLKNLELNIFQTLAVTGLIVSLVSHVGLTLMQKEVDRFWAVYIVWLTVLTLSTLIRVEGADHDNHHEH